jgi:hypothetical protein
MPNLSDHQSSETTKLLLIGDNGSGKSGALASLASAGYNLRILDLDNGLDILKNVLRDPKAGYASDSISRVVYETLTDKMKASGGKLVPSQATVWQRAIKLLDNWKTESHSLGPLVSWTPKDVLVIDSLTMLSNAAMNFVLSMNARLGQQPHQSDWYVGQQMIESLLQMLLDENVRCNVVMNCHITFIGEENGPVRGYPASLGKALPPKIGSYFNTILMAQAVGQGANAKQKILTRTQGMIGLKTSAPGLVASEYPIETGLAEYFKAIRGVPAAAAKPALVAKAP